MKNNNNKKRVLPLLLAVLLLVSAGAYGTRAFFTDQETLKTTIEIKTGKLNITSAGTEEWKYEPITKNIDEKYVMNDKLNVSPDGIQAGFTPIKNGDPIGSEAYITNARPGDAFTRIFKFKNEGTLDLKLAFDTDLKTISLDDYIVTFTDENGGKEILEPGQEATYSIKISVTNASTNKDGLNSKALEYMEKYLKIDATQPNAN